MTCDFSGCPHEATCDCRWGHKEQSTASLCDLHRDAVFERMKPLLQVYAAEFTIGEVGTLKEKA